jgi:FkbM family methyltransferase
MDVGANVGEVSRRLLRKVGSSGQVYAFEPNPELVRNHLSRVTAPNFHVYQRAVSSSVGSATLFVDCREELPAVASSLRVLDDLHESGKVRPISVETTTIDAFVATEKIRPNFIKIDVEGHEIDVFRGAVETIRTFRPVIVFEFWETWWRKGIQNIFAFLHPHYRLVRVKDGIDAAEYYSHNTGVGVVDIAAFPRPESIGAFAASNLQWTL